MSRLRSSRERSWRSSGRGLRGKTTLLKIAAGIECPDQGERVARQPEIDRPSGSGSEPAIRARDRVDRPRRAGVEDRGLEVRGVAACLARASARGAESRCGRLSGSGRRECMGRRWGDISNWQQVLVGLARAFAGSPRVVVIDDLLDALGGPATEEVSDLLRSLVEESEPRCGVLMSASDIESATVRRPGTRRSRARER